MGIFNLSTKRIGIDLGTPNRAYLLPRLASSRRKSACTGQAAYGFIYLRIY